MLETKEQKRYFAISMVLVLLVGLMSYWDKSNFRYRDPGEYTNKSQSVSDAEAYLAYLNTIETDPEASKELFQMLLTEDDVHREVVDALQADKPAEPPVIDEKTLHISSNNSTGAVTEYLSKTIGETYAFNNATIDTNQNLFGASAYDINSLKSQLASLVDSVQSVEVPKDALPAHKAMLTAFNAYNKLIDAASQFDTINYQNNDGVWPEVYQSYVVANESTRVYGEQVTALANKYKISEIPIHAYFADASTQPESAEKVPFIRTAYAFPGLPSFSITLGDIPRIIMDGVKEGLRSAFLQFMGTMINKLVDRIEKNYMISNFLYYSDALVTYQYTDDYLDKYASSSKTTALDRKMIKSFIPQLACGRNRDEVKDYFKAKSKSHLGFDPADVGPNDKDYYMKMWRVGNFLSDPKGWETQYEDIAAQAADAAEKAALLELTSSGLKTPRDASKASISKSINSIVSSERASFTALLSLGINNADSLISAVVGKLTQNLINHFIFDGITGANTTITGDLTGAAADTLMDAAQASGASTSTKAWIGVLKESTNCADSFKMSPIVGIDDTKYNQSSGLSADDAKAIACAPNSNIDSDCTNAVIAYLGKCAASGVVNMQVQCNIVIDQEYVKTLTNLCQLPAVTRPGLSNAQCANLTAAYTSIRNGNR